MSDEPVEKWAHERKFTSEGDEQALRFIAKRRRTTAEDLAAELECSVPLAASVLGRLLALGFLDDCDEQEEIECRRN